MTFQEIMELHPRPSGVDRDSLIRCIETCLDCSASCTACADASLSEPDFAEMIRVIRLCADCADACDATRRVVTRQTAPNLDLMRTIVQACATACVASAAECDLHAAHHEHCRLCAEVCRRCKEACDAVLAVL